MHPKIRLNHPQPDQSNGYRKNAESFRTDRKPRRVSAPLLCSLYPVVLNMPSLQTALPPELANNAIRLYRECLRRAKYIGHRKHNTELLVDMVRQQFKKHMHETDPEKIQKLKDGAARGLINHILYESEQMTGSKFSKSKQPNLLYPK
ncbi:hypothetical protein GmHk_15G043625 [Glycine max]|nr:hypothetical protein GmHk_15G043625 [Glycine max]